MKPKKMAMCVVSVLILLIILGMPLLAQEVPSETNPILEETDKMIDFGMGLFNWGDIERLENELKAQMPQLQHFSLQQEVTAALRGEKPFSLKAILNQVLEALWGEGKLFVQLGARFILIVLMCNLLQSLSSSFKSKETTKAAFFVCYLVIIYSVIQSFVVMVDLAKQVLETLIRIMLVCIPTLLAFMSTTGYAASASAMAPIIIGTLTLSSKLMQQFVLPCIVSVVLLEMVGSMSETYKVDKLIKLFYKGIQTALKLLVGISMGVLGMYRLTIPYTDMALKKATLKFSTAFIPILGNATQGAVEFVSQFGGLLKNTFSAGVIIWIVLVMSIPLIKIFVYTAIYHLAGALIEPLGDKKMANLATKLGKGSQFILSTVGMVGLLCICSLLICMSIGMGNV